jgi:hypothetical protein
MKPFTVVALALAIGLATAVSPCASSSPDGLERVAGDLGFAENGHRDGAAGADDRGGAAQQGSAGADDRGGAAQQGSAGADDRGDAAVEGSAGRGDAPLADYAFPGIENERVATGLAGFIGVLAVFALGSGLAFVIRRRAWT